MEHDHQDKSKTQIKKEAEELQKLGEELAQLPSLKLKRMALPKELLKALLDAKSIKSNIAGRRQRQFIGALMRDVDPEPIRHALLQNNADFPVETEIVQEARMWMDRLLTNDPDQLEAFLCVCPSVERQRLRQLLRHIKKEKATGTSSKSLTALEKIIMACVKNPR